MQRKHIHVISSDGEAKFWLEPDIELAKNYRYARSPLDGEAYANTKWRRQHNRNMPTA